MHIDRTLHMVQEFSRGDEAPLVIHSTPLSEEVFEQYYKLFAATTNSFVVDGIGYFSPRYAALTLREVARRPLALLQKETDAYRQAESVIEERLRGLFNELHRLTLVLAYQKGAWDTIPLDDAKAAGLITEKEYARVDSALVFFTSISESVPLEDREQALGGLAACNARTELLNCTEFMRSLATLMTAASSGKSQAASPPSSRGSPPQKDSSSSSNGSTSASSPGTGSNRKPTGIVFSSPQN